MKHAHVILKKNHAQRVQQGFPWVYSNEINTIASPLKNFYPGEEVIVLNSEQKPLGKGYINSHSLITVRLLTTSHQANLDENFFYQRLQQANSFREHLFEQPFYRMVYGEADHLAGLIIDRYDQYLVLQCNTAGMELKKPLILGALRKLFPGIAGIISRNDSMVRTREGLPRVCQVEFGEFPDSIQIIENNIPFYVPILNGQKTGWFYDQRLNRQRLQQYVKGKSVLDVFSYLGGFGIAAGVAGASTVTCIESSPLACDFIQQNARLNQLPHLDIIKAQALPALNKLIADKRQFDVIILDPPAFIKTAKDKKNGVLAYQRLNEKALKLLAPQGLLVTCSCSMHLSTNDLQIVLAKAARGMALQIIEFGLQAPDHPIHLLLPESQYLKAIFARKLS